MKRLLFCLMVIVLMGSCDTMKYGVDRSKVMKLEVHGDGDYVDLTLSAYRDSGSVVRIVCGALDTVFELSKYIKIDDSVVDTMDGWSQIWDMRELNHVEYRCDLEDSVVMIYGDVEYFKCYVGGTTYDTKCCLDVSQNDRLAYLDCGYCYLETLKLAEHKNMVYLKCGDNTHLSQLDVTGCPKLVFLDCGINKIKELDVFNSVDLEMLYCGPNKLKQLDVSQNRKLTHLECLGNELVELDVSGCEALYRFDCSGNKLEKLVMGNHPKLHKIDCMKNRLRSLDVTGCPKLWSLLCGENEIHEIDVSKNGNLWRFGYDEDKIKEVDWVNEEAAKDR